MVAFWWVFSVVSYLAGFIFFIKKMTWLMVEDSIRATKPSDLDGPDWLLASMSALFWPMVAPFYIVYKITRTIASVTGIARWIDSKPLPRVDRKLAKIERKSEQRQAKLDKLNENIRAAEIELAEVNANIKQIYSDAGYHPDGRVKYGTPGHRGW